MSGVSGGEKSCPMVEPIVASSKTPSRAPSRGAEHRIERTERTERKPGEAARASRGDMGRVNAGGVKDAAASSASFARLHGDSRSSELWKRSSQLVCASTYR